ncbi:MAG: hypothetical protein GXO26_08205 [Crenarchaeota archaeon]|nr:hypothetical protein [Thermoproteota archaeon]
MVPLACCALDNMIIIIVVIGVEVLRIIKCWKDHLEEIEYYIEEENEKDEED